MKATLSLTLLLSLVMPAAAEWRAEVVVAPGLVSTIENDGDTSRISIDKNWYRFDHVTGKLVPASPPVSPKPPQGALPDSHVAVGTKLVARAWLADPTDRYDHGVLGDTIEAGSLVIERRDGRRGTVTLGPDAVFEDLLPRIASSDGHDWVVVVKSYLARGSALAVVNTESMSVAAETPPIGRPHAWLNPAGIADFTGHGTTQIAVVRQPHVVGHLELWSWTKQRLTKILEIPDVANHFIGSRALGMSWTADFDGDGHPDLAVPSLDRRSLRIIGFAPEAHNIARVPMPARLVTNFGMVMIGGKPALLAGLEDGQLMLIRNR